MVYTGKPSKGCHNCRRRKIQVSTAFLYYPHPSPSWPVKQLWMLLLSILALHTETYNCHSVINCLMDVLNAPIPDVRVQAIQSNRTLCFGTKPRASPEDPRPMHLLRLAGRSRLLNLAGREPSLPPLAEPHQINIRIHQWP
jgi:hypothetical protein